MQKRSLKSLLVVAGVAAVALLAPAGMSSAGEACRAPFDLFVGTIEGGASAGPEVPRFRMENMDPSVDPRVDFYRYAAGGWMQRTEIPADKSRWGGFDELAQRNWWNIRILLEETMGAQDEPASPRHQVGGFFASAMDTATIEARGLAPLKAAWAKVAVAADRAELMRVVAREQLGISGPLLRISAHADQRQSGIYGFYLSQGGLSLPSRAYYFDERFERERAALVEHITAMFELAGDSAAEARRKAELVFRLEKIMAENSRTPTALRDRAANYHKMTRADAAAAWPGLELEAFFGALPLPAEAPDVIVGQPEFFAALGELLAERPLDDWKIYVQWHQLAAAAAFLPAAFEEERFRFTGTVLAGTPTMEPRWQRAARVIDRSIGEALGQLYVERYFPPEVKARLDEMIVNIKGVMRDRLTQLEWMTEATRQLAVAKFDRFTAQIGYPPKWRDYSGIEIHSDDYFGNVLRAAVAEGERQLSRVGQPVDKDEFSLTPQTVNAYFQPTGNRIVFLAGILQPPFFDPKLDDAVNYGAIGAVIGHEITHGFDDQGRRFDANGNMTDWWGPEDDAEFKRRAQGLIEHYNGFEVRPGLFVNGELTQGENIADLGGVSIAFEALQRSSAGKPPAELIGGLTPEQRFFVSWAQQWRTLYRDEAIQRQITVGPHAPGNVRAVGPLMNVDAFFAAFGIQPGDPMWRDPDERARIW